MLSTREWLRGLVQVILPRACPGCGRGAEGLCVMCLKRVVLIRSQGCYYCGRLGGQGRTCPACRKRSALSGVVVAAHYEEPLKAAIWKFKYAGERGLSGSLAPLLLGAIRGSRATEVTSVPLHRRREWWRGYNQAELLAKEMGLPYSRLLQRVRLTPPQVELNRRERLANLNGAFRAVGSPPPRVLLVDDVATTGATLEAAARVLREAGAREVWAAVLARHK